MRSQQQIWYDEHVNNTAFPSYKSPEPSSMVVQFAEFLKQQNVTFGQVVDVGCGKGRNSIFLAEQGFEVCALDYIAPAINHASEQAKLSGMNKNICFWQIPVDERWPFEDNIFDVAVDCFSSIDIETKEGREIYRSEMLRTLKPGGYAMVAVVSTEDEFEKEAIATHPGPEKNSTLWPGTGKFQKDYDEEELKEFYRMFEIVELKKITKTAKKMGRDFMATNFLVILKKPMKG